MVSLNYLYGHGFKNSADPVSGSLNKALRRYFNRNRRPQGGHFAHIHR